MKKNGLKLIKVDKSKFHLLLKSVIPGLVILVLMGVLLYEFDQSIQNEIDELKIEVEQIIDRLMDKRIERLNTIANAIVGFYLGSQNVDSDEFESFSKKLLENNAEIKNLFILDNQKIIASYPHSEFKNTNIHTSLPGYPIIMDSEKTMLLEFPVKDNLTLLIAVPFDYFITPELLGYNSLKLTLYNIQNSEILYQHDSNNLEQSDNIIFSQNQLNSSLEIYKNTTLNGFKIKEIHTLKYLVWITDFEKSISNIQIFLIIFGILFSSMSFILLYRTFKLQISLHEQSYKLNKTNIQLNKAIELKNEFAAMINHELKTPLTPIKGFCDLLKMQSVGKLNEQQLDYINEIYQNANQLEELIQNLLTVRKLDMDKMTFQLSEIQIDDFLPKIHETWNMIMGEKNIQFVLNPGKKLCVKCDEQRLKQIFANLINNAVDFVPKSKGKIEIGALSEDNFVKFYVKDNGVGISEENQKNLFKKFYQVDSSVTRKHGGTGLGLSICQGLVEGMNGTIWVQSKEGSGTTFFFKLPQCFK